MTTITKAELMSEVAIRAMSIADYRLRHNLRYEKWLGDRRTAYKLAKAFDAIIRARSLNRRSTKSRKRPKNGPPENKNSRRNPESPASR